MVAMDTPSGSPTPLPPDAQSPAEKVFAVKDLAALIVSKLSLETRADAANFQLVCKALYDARGAVPESQWRALCHRLSPAAARARARDGASVDWRRLARALRPDTWDVHEWSLENYRVVVDISLRGAVFYTCTFRLSDANDDDFCHWEVRLHDLEDYQSSDEEGERYDHLSARTHSDGTPLQPWHITSADLCHGEQPSDLPFRAQAFLLREDGAVARLASNIPPNVVEPLSDSCCMMDFDLTEQLSERVPRALVNDPTRPSSWWSFINMELSTPFIVTCVDKDESTPVILPGGGVVVPTDAQALAMTEYERPTPYINMKINEDGDSPNEIAALKLQNLPWERTA